MFSHDELAVDRWMNRRRRGGCQRIYGSRSTPIRRWKLHAGDSSPGSDGVSARKIAASVWRLSDCGVFGGGLNFVLCSSLPILETEGVTKWDLCHSKAFDVDDKGTDMAALRKAKKCIKEFGDEGGLMTKISNCIKKLDQEGASGLKSEYHKIVRPMVQNLAGDIIREREKCKRMDVMNSKLHRDVTKTKLSTRKVVQRLEREKEARKLLEQACNELAKVVEGNKTEIIKLRNHHRSFKQNAEEERQKMQIGEVWKEEREHRTLLKAQSVLEDKWAELNILIADAEALFSKNNSIVLSNTNGKQTMTRDDICALNNNTVAKISSVPYKQSGRKDGRNPHVVRAIKGHIVWARGVERQGPGRKHLEEKLERQRRLIRNVLTQNKGAKSKEILEF